MAVKKKTLVSKTKQAGTATPDSARTAPRAHTTPSSGVPSIHQIVAKKLAVGKLVTAKGIR